MHFGHIRFDLPPQGEPGRMRPAPPLPAALQQQDVLRAGMVQQWPWDALGAGAAQGWEWDAARAGTGPGVPAQPSSTPVCRLYPGPQHVDALVPPTH